MVSEVIFGRGAQNKCHLQTSSTKGEHFVTLFEQQEPELHLGNGGLCWVLGSDLLPSPRICVIQNPLDLTRVGYTCFKGSDTPGPGFDLPGFHFLVETKAPPRIQAFWYRSWVCGIGGHDLPQNKK